MRKKIGAVVLDPDVAEVFDTADSFNRLLALGDLGCSQATHRPELTQTIATHLICFCYLRPRNRILAVNARPPKPPYVA